MGVWNWFLLNESLTVTPAADGTDLRELGRGWKAGAGPVCAASRHLHLLQWQLTGKLHQVGVSWHTFKLSYQIYRYYYRTNHILWVHGTESVKHIHMNCCSLISLKPQFTCSSSATYLYQYWFTLSVLKLICQHLSV